jgi:hypothetical protein
VAGYEESKNAVVGELITTTEFSGAHEYSLGKVKPIIYGQAYAHECLPVDAGSITTLTADMASDSTAAIAVTDTTSFPSSGDIWIESEKVTYTGKTAATFTGITRGVAGTATAHNRGAYAVEDQTNYDYLISGHSCQTPTAVYINGVALTSGWSKVASGGNDLLRITDGEALREALRAGVIDDLGVTPVLANDITIVRDAAVGSTSASWSLCSSGTYCYGSFGISLTFPTEAGCSFSTVPFSFDYNNLAKLEIWIGVNGGSATLHATVFDSYDGSGPNTTYIDGSYSTTISRNDDITAISITGYYDMFGDITSDITLTDTPIRQADVAIGPTSSKDEYAYANGLTTTELSLIHI